MENFNSQSVELDDDFSNPGFVSLLLKSTILSCPFYLYIIGGLDSSRAVAMQRFETFHFS